MRLGGACCEACCDPRDDYKRIAAGDGDHASVMGSGTGIVRCRSYRDDIEQQGTIMELMQDEAYFERVLGAAVVRKWADLPRSIQETLFEEAILAGHRSQRDESLREQLALFLHNRHPRTENNGA